MNTGRSHEGVVVAFQRDATVLLSQFRVGLQNASEPTQVLANDSIPASSESLVHQLAQALSDKASHVLRGLRPVKMNYFGVRFEERVVGFHVEFNIKHDKRVVKVDDGALIGRRRKRFSAFGRGHILDEGEKVDPGLSHFRNVDERDASV